MPLGGGHDYPLTFSVDYPDRDLDRLSTGFRILWIIPIAILAGTVEGGSYTTGSGARYALGGVGILVIPVLRMLLFRKKYPRCWYDWNLQLSRFSNRIAVYLARTTATPPPTSSSPSTCTSPTRTPSTSSAAACRWSSGCWRSPTTSCCSS